jgi:hypothetical protein
MPTLRRLRRAGPPTFLALAAALLAGCAAGNDRALLGRASSGSVTLPFVADGRDRPEQPPRADVPSVTSLARANWRETTITAPVDGVYANPRYARAYRLTDQTNRQRAGAVTASNALESDGGTPWTQLAEGALAGPAAFYDALAMPFRMLGSNPDDIVRALPDDHARTHVGVAQTLARRAPEPAPPAPIPPRTPSP